MTDLHTHILPGMDDGAVSPEMSLAMLRMEREQQVGTVAVTPHCVLSREQPEEFLKRRARSWDILRKTVEQSGEPVPEIRLGAEVAWQTVMPGIRDLERLCYENTGYILLEPPAGRWSPRLLHDLWSFRQGTGLVPVIAHLDRYLPYQERGCIRELLAMEFPLQFSAHSLFRFFLRRNVLRVIPSCQLPMLISDCHNLTSRPPDLRMGLNACAAHLETWQVARLAEASDAIFKK